MVNQNLAEATEGQKLAVDYTTMYDVIEAMQILGLAQRKADTTCSKKFLTWTGFPKFRKKFDGIVSLKRYFAVWPQSGELTEPVPITREDMEAEIKYKAGKPIERFLLEIFFRIMRSEDRVLSKAEVDLIKQKYLLADCNNLEFEQRKALWKVLKKVMAYAGIIDLHVKVLPPNEGQKDRTQIKGLKWVFKSPREADEQFDETHPSYYEFNDYDYFNQRKLDFIIEFRKEPPKTVIQSFDNSGFAMFKGRNWRFFMQKLYCIIGRSPVNYKKKGKQLGMKVVWHVDVDLGHLRKVSRQHALIIFNFEGQYFEIKCLSRKYPVYVNRQPLLFSDGPRPIQSGSIIAISSESFYFLLPPQQGQPIQHQYMQLQNGVMSYVAPS